MPHFFEPRHLVGEGKYKKFRRRAQIFVQLCRWGGCQRECDDKKKKLFQELFRLVDRDWARSEKWDQYWRKRYDSFWYFVIPISPFGLIPMDVVMLFFDGLPGSASHGGMSVYEVCWAFIHDRFDDPTITEERIIKERVVTKARVMIILEVLVNTQNGLVSSDASGRPISFLRVANDGKCVDPNYETECGYWGSAEPVGIIVGSGSSVDFINPFDQGVRMSVSALSEEGAPSGAWHRTQEVHIPGIIRGFLGDQSVKGVHRHAMLLPAPHGSCNTFYGDGAINISKYGPLDDQYYAWVDFLKCAGKLTLNPAFTFTALGPIAYDNSFG